MSVKISPPVRNVPRPTVLAPPQRSRLNIRHSPAKKLRIAYPAEERMEPRRWVLCLRTCPATPRPVTRLMKVVPHERIHKHKRYGKDDDVAILYYYYHVETRRKCKITIEGVVLIVNSTGLPVNCNISILIDLNFRFSTGR